MKGYQRTSGEQRNRKGHFLCAPAGAFLPKCFCCKGTTWRLQEESISVFRIALEWRADRLLGNSASLISDSKRIIGERHSLLHIQCIGVQYQQQLPTTNSRLSGNTVDMVVHKRIISKVNNRIKESTEVRDQAINQAHIEPNSAVHSCRHHFSSCDLQETPSPWQLYNLLQRTFSP